jgi:hypothetical protein
MGGGGGGRTTTTTAGIDPEFKPQLKRGLDIAQTRLEDQMSGKQKIMADLTGQQKDSLGYGQSLATDAILGRGIYDDRNLQRKALQDVAGTGAGMASSGNTYGSARSQAAINKAVSDAADKFNVRRRKVATQGVKQLGDVGSVLQEDAQRKLDERGLALDQFFGRLTANAPKTTTNTGGGGK